MAAEVLCAWVDATGGGRRWVRPSPAEFRFEKADRGDEWYPSTPDAKDFARFAGWIAGGVEDDGKYIVLRTDGRDRPDEKHGRCPHLTLDLRHDASARHVAVDYVRIAIFSKEPERRAFAARLGETLSKLAEELGPKPAA